MSGENGLGSTGGTVSMGGAGGYYTKGSSVANVQSFFNQGGIHYQIDSTSDNNRTRGGSGGNAGAGGTVYYYDLANIHAYNGDRITNGDYTTTYYEYDENGNLTTTVASTVTKQDGTVIVPAKIFAQAGIIRATYMTNQHMTEDEASSYEVEYCGTNHVVVNVQITSRTTTATTGYGQGIGSGAGNLEKSNGTLKNISEIN